jgi:hypothetical protein
MIPSFAGQRIFRVEVNFLVRMYTHEGWQIDLEGDVYLTTPTTGTLYIPLDGSVQEPPAELQALVDAQITDVLVSPEGHLAINVGSTQLSVRASEMYESWQIYGPKGEMLVCTPGGELEEWGPRS